VCFTRKKPTEITFNTYTNIAITCTCPTRCD